MLQEFKICIEGRVAGCFLTIKHSLFDTVTIYGQTFTRCSHSFLQPTLKKPVHPYYIPSALYTLSKFSVKDDLSKR